MDIIIYPISKGRTDRRERSAAAKCSSDLRQKLNDRNSAQKFRRLIACNFSPGDLVVTLTYSDAALPATPEQARDKKLKPFINSLRRELREGGAPELKYMYVTEGYHGDHRLHHHIIVPASPGIRDRVRSLWKKNGENVDFEHIAARGYSEWAFYLTKEPRKTGRRRVGDRMWTPSLNLVKPTVTTYEVEDDYEYELPPNVFVERNETDRNEWFVCQYISFRRLPQAAKN